MLKDYYTTADIWLATWLDTQDIPILGVDWNGRGIKVLFRFSNEGDQAWQLSTEYREGNALVNISDFRRSHKYILIMADRARRQGNYSGEDRGNERLDGTYYSAE